MFLGGYNKIVVKVVGNLPQQNSEESSSTELEILSSSLLHIIIEVS